MHIFTKGSTLALLAAVCTFAAHAATVYTSQSAFDAAATGLTTYNVPPPSSGTSQYLNSPVSFGPATLSATGGFDIFNDGGYGSGQTYIGTNSASALSISLTPPITAIGFNFGTYDGPKTVSIDVNGVLAASINTPGASGSSFFGVTSTTPISSVDLSYVSEGGEIDILNGEIGSIAATPEPSSFALLGTGLLGVAAQLRRRLARS